ncbi:MAG: hypothetical protein ACXVCV_01950 [Polyangia bacterium]
MRIFVPALFVLAACGAGPQGDDESALTIVRHPPPRVVLSVQSLEPAQPVEGRMVLVHFTLDNFTAPTMNGRVRATISPVASAPVAGGFDWPVTNLAPGQSTSGVVAFVAPPAAKGNLLDLFFEDGATHAQQNDVRQPLDVAGAYALGVLTIQADNPRGHEYDVVSFGFADQVSADVGSSNFETNRTLHAGELTTGTGGDVFALLPDDTSTVATALIVAALGGSPDKAATIGNLASSLARDVVTIGTVESQLFPALGCDGPVAVDRRNFTGRQLYDDVVAAHTFINPATGLTYRRYDETVHYNGFSSPPICGAVSNYDVVWSVTSATGPTFPDIAITPPVGVTRGGRSVQFHPPNIGPVDWSVEGGAANGFIDANGLYTPPARSLFNEPIQIHARQRSGSLTFNAYVTGAPAGLTLGL